MAQILDKQPMSTPIDNDEMLQDAIEKTAQRMIDEMTEKNALALLSQLSMYDKDGNLLDE